MFASQMILFFLQLYIINTTAYSRKNLELVHVIFRHGDRTPEKIHLYPTDPNLKTIWTVPFGEHTEVGKLKLKKLGNVLAKRYGKFLGENFHNSLVYARSTDYNRTKEALQIVLKQMFPQRLQFDTISYIRRNDHVLGQPYANCAAYRYKYHQFLNSTEGLKMYSNFTELRSFIKNKTTLEPTSKATWELYFTFMMETECGMIIPEWALGIYPQPLEQLVLLEYISRSATNELKKLSSGFLFRKIVKDTRMKIADGIPEKIFLYSGHDFTVASFLKFLNVYHTHIPAYAAAIFVEIHNIKNERRVKVYYKNAMGQKLKRMEIPNCHRICKFENFVKLYKHLIPKSKKECAM